MKKDLEWFCMEWDMSTERPCVINVMYAIDINDLKKRLKNKEIKNYNELRGYLKKEFMYRFWCKCEHEIVVNSWPHRDRSDERKVDVYAQISPNLDRITEYVIRELNLDFEYSGDDYDHTFGLEGGLLC